MERNGKIYVSKSFKKEEFLAFDLKLRNGKRRDIDKAITMFRERMEERYFAPIELLNNGNKDTFKNGFASMAICCLLIDTFYQFEHGVYATTNNHRCYTDFLRARMGEIFDTQEKADKFYTDIRCGILHSAQTKKGSRLSCNQDQVVKYVGNVGGSISVDVRGITDALKDYFNEYCSRVRYDCTTQSNFVKKLKKMFTTDN